MIKGLRLAIQCMCFGSVFAIEILQDQRALFAHTVHGCPADRSPSEANSRRQSEPRWCGGQLLGALATQSRQFSVHSSTQHTVLEVHRNAH